MDIPFDYIYIDTCVFRKESFFKKSGGVARLFDLAEQGWIKILMPEIAQREWLNHFKEVTFLKFAEVEKKATLMGNTNEADAFVEAHKKLIGSYDNLVEKTFDEHLKRAQVITISTSYACDTIEAVVDKYFAKEKPFGGKGKEKEFPDAFVLASLEKYAGENGINKIQMFTVDKDITQYNSSLFVLQNTGDYLNDFITKRIPEYEHEEKRKRDEQDIGKLYKYLENGLGDFGNQIYNHVEEFLSDVSLYSERFLYTDIEEAYVEKLRLQGGFKNIEILSVGDDVIRALYVVDVSAYVKVNHFCEEESIWDSEDKKYIFEKYEDTILELSSVVKVIFEIDRTRLDMEQEPCVVIAEIDTDDLEDAINDNPQECHHTTKPSNLNWGECFSGSSVARTMTKNNNIYNGVSSSLEMALSSVSALQASLQQMRTPEVWQGLQQMCAINSSVADSVQAIRKYQEAIPVNAFSGILKLAANNK